MMPNTLRLVLFFLLSGLVACDSLAIDPESQTTPIVSPSSTASSSPSAEPSPQQLEVSSAVIQVEGTPLELSLNLFDEPELPFTTYVPTGDFVTDVVEADEKNIAVTFYSNLGSQVNESAYMRILFPKQPTSLEKVQEAIFGKEGLLAQNNWQIADRTSVVVYPWAREQVMFRSSLPSQSTAGQIFIGEQEGQAFYILLHYPVEYAEGFEPRAMVILDELRFRPQSPRS